MCLFCSYHKTHQATTGCLLFKIKQKTSQRSKAVSYTSSVASHV